MWLRVAIAVVLTLATAALMPHGGASPYSGDYMFASSRLRFMSQANATSASTVAEITRIMVPTPHWACQNPRFVFSTVLGIDGSTDPEQGLGNARTIDGFTVEYPAGTFTAGAFSGSASYAQNDLTTVISDPVSVTIPADSAAVWVRTLQHVASSGLNIPGLYTTNLGAGEGMVTNASASNLTALLTGGSVATYGSHADGPMAMLCQGWNGTPVVLLMGDSICKGDNDNQQGDARGMFGYLVRGIDDNASSPRMVGMDWCVSGQSQAAASEGAITDGHYGYRIALINAVAALNPGNHLPMSSIVVEHCVNDPSSGGLTADLPNFWRMAHQHFPNMPVVQTTCSPNTTNSNNHLWDDTGDQTPNSDYGAGQSVPTFNAALLAGTYDCSGGAQNCVDGFIDTTSYFWKSGVWNVPGFATTLAANVNAGDSSVSLNSCPSVGDNVVLGAGTANVESKTSGGVGYFVATASGSPCTVTFQAQANGNAVTVSKAHTSGDAVANAYTFGSPHPSLPGHIYIAGAVIAAKNAGVFK